MVTEHVDGDLHRTYQYAPSGERLSMVAYPDSGIPESSPYSYNPGQDVVAITAETGDTRATYGYTAYGSPDADLFTGVDTPDPDAEPYNIYRFNAMPVDPGSGDYNMGARQYSPPLNRFLTRDAYNGALSDLGTATSPWTLNRYAFASGNPISRIEVDGHCWVFDWAREACEHIDEYASGVAKGIVNAAKETVVGLAKANQPGAPVSWHVMRRSSGCSRSTSGTAGWDRRTRPTAP